MNLFYPCSGPVYLVISIDIVEQVPEDYIAFGLDKVFAYAAHSVC
jgi:hypothetical protein